MSETLRRPIGKKIYEILLTVQLSQNELGDPHMHKHTPQITSLLMINKPI